MIQLTQLRELTLSAPSDPTRHDYLCAASGLVKVGGFFYVVADDENHLGVFRANTDEPGKLIRLFAGALPDTKRKRKGKKPDLEALVCLPPFARYPTGALLCVASGSTPNRNTGALLALDADGAIVGQPVSIDLTATYDGLTKEIPKLNIEGAAVIDDDLVLMQRGNHQGSRNACIRFSLPDVLDRLGSANSLGALVPTAFEFVDLGEIDGVRLCFSDVATVPGVGLAVYRDRRGHSRRLSRRRLRRLCCRNHRRLSARTARGTSFRFAEGRGAFTLSWSVRCFSSGSSPTPMMRIRLHNCWRAKSASVDRRGRLPTGTIRQRFSTRP